MLNLPILIILKNQTLVDWVYVHWDCTSQGQRARYSANFGRQLTFDNSLSKEDKDLIKADVSKAATTYNPPAKLGGQGLKSKKASLQCIAKRKLAKEKKGQADKAHRMHRRSGGGARVHGEVGGEDSGNIAAQGLVDAINAQ